MIAHQTSAAQYPHTHKTTPIYAAGRRHPIGQVIEGVFVKYIIFSKHTLQRPPAIAFDVATLDAAENAGAVEAEIHDTESRNVYSAPLHLIRRAGFPVRRGFGNQWALALEYWSRNGLQSEVEARADAAAERAELAAVRQLDLFGGVR
jgi:hypothetical protein